MTFLPPLPGPLCWMGTMLVDSLTSRVRSAQSTVPAVGGAAHTKYSTCAWPSRCSSHFLAGN